MSIFGDKWFLIHTSPSSGVQQPHVAGGSLLTVGTERGQNCRLGQVCIYQVPAGCKVQDNTGVHTNLRSSVHAGVRLERSIGYILKAVFQEFKGSFGWLFPDQAFLLSSSLDGSNGPPNTCFVFFFWYLKDLSKPVDPKPISVFLLLSLPHSPRREPHHHPPGLKKERRRAWKSRHV